MFAILFLYFFAYQVHGVPVVPKYMLYFNTDVIVSDDEQSKDFLDTSGIIVEWYNDTTAYMHGSFKFLKEFGENTMVDMQLEKEFSGRREIVFSHVVCDLCKEFVDENSKYYDYLKNVDVPPCPIQPGEYKINDNFVSNEDFPLNISTAGRYIVTLYYYDITNGDCFTNKTFLGSVTFGLSVETV